MENAEQPANTLRLDTNSDNSNNDEHTEHLNGVPGTEEEGRLEPTPEASPHTDRQEVSLAAVEQPPNLTRGGVETNAAVLGSQTAQPLDPRPRLHLPGDGRTVSDFASDLGQLLAPHGIYRFSGAASIYNDKLNVLDAITPTRFRTWMERFVITLKVKDSGVVEKTIGSGDAGTVLVSDHFLDHLRVVHRVNGVRLPVARADGAIELLPEGYDRASQILTVGVAVNYPTDMPWEEVQAFLREFFKDFPFADDARSMAVALAAMLTLFGLDLLPAQTLLPVFLYRANLPGLGKGLLAQAAMIPVLGNAPTGVQPKGEEEMRKFFFALAKEGRPVAFLDNVADRLASPTLESFVTTSTVTGRVLGSSRTLNCRKNTVVLVTGNDAKLNADMARRTLISELFLDGDPAERTIEHPLDENRLLALRPQMLAALYALVREWAAAGKPGPTKVNSNFVAWSQTIGGIVEHAGFGSVTDTPAGAASVDPREVDMTTLTHAFYEQRRTEGLTFSEVVVIARAHRLFVGVLPPEGDLSRAERTSVSRLFTAQDQRAFPNGLRFVSLGTGRARRYAVQLVGRREEPAGA